MLLSNETIKNSLKGLKISGVIGLSALFSTTCLINSNLYAATSSPATCNVSELTSSLNRQIPTGYIKANYTLKISENSEPTTANELTASDAAEIMAQEIYRYLHINLEGKTIELTHNLTVREGYKPSWHTNIDLDKLCTLHVDIDSVTGETNFVIRNQLIPMSAVDPSLENAFHEDLEKSYTNKFNSNIENIKSLITNSGLIPEKITSITYNNLRAFTKYDGPIGQEKPIGVLLSHDLDVTTESGKKYRLNVSEDFTRIDGIYMPDYVTSSDAAIAKAIATRKRA